MVDLCKDPGAVGRFHKVHHCLASGERVYRRTNIIFAQKIMPHSHSSPGGSNSIEKTETAVVGGGIIGLSIAWELVQRGHRVSVYERNDAAGDDAGMPDFVDTNRPTSWTAAGILPPANFELASDPLDRFRGYSHGLWPGWAERLREVTGIDVGLIRCGGYYLAETVGEAAAMGGMVAYWRELDIQCQPLTQAALRQRLPLLAAWIDNNAWINEHPDRAAWWVADEYQVRTPRVLKALHTACADAGVRFISNTAITRIEESADEVTFDAAGSSSTQHFTAQQIVLAGGAATGSIAPSFRLQQALIPIRGQVLLLHCDKFSEPVVVNIGNRYLVARGDGHVLVGSCEEESGFAQHTTATMIEQLRAFAIRVCPLLADAPEVRRWAGLRPMTFDGFPIIGRLPTSGRIHVAAGHYRSGIHFAPATATAIADLVDRQNTFMDLSAFSVSKQQQSLQHTS